MTTEQDIINYIDAKGTPITFVELENNFPDLFEGNGLLMIEGKNVVVWEGFSLDGIKVVGDLLESERLIFYPADIYDYYVQGRTLRYPLVMGPEVYDSTHWAPTELYTASLALDTGIYPREED